MSILRDTILNINDMQLKKITVAEWGVDVYAKPLTVKEQAEFESGAYDLEGKVKGDFYARYLIQCLVDETGAKIFEPTDIEALEAKNAEILLNIFKQIKSDNSPN